MRELGVIAIIDDDEAVRDSLRMTLAAQDLAADFYPSAEAFLAGIRRERTPSCIVCDVRMPGMSGVELQQHIASRYATIPVILVTGHGDIRMAVTAVKHGAHDFLEKPFTADQLLESIRSAITRAAHQRSRVEERESLAVKLKDLSERQRQVMTLAARGLSSKEIAIELNISPRTVDTHRAWVMERTGARNVAELVRIVMRMEELDAEPPGR